MTARDDREAQQEARLARLEGKQHDREVRKDQTEHDKEAEQDTRLERVEVNLTWIKWLVVGNVSLSAGNILAGGAPAATILASFVVLVIGIAADILVHLR